VSIDELDFTPSLVPPKPVDLDRAEAAIAELLCALGQEDKAEVMQRTPRRVAELYAQLMNPPDIDLETTLKTFTNPTPGTDNLIVVNGVHYVSLCEHHLAPAFGVADLAYVPGDRVVGYSKLKKGLNYIARQPQLNERIVADTLDFVEERLEPRGIALVLRSVHTCIALRTNAPAQEIVTVTGYRGVLAEDPHRSAFDATWTSAKPLFLGP
jgi:GTP cyclohydrolase I